MDYQAEIASLVARLDAMQANERRLIDELLRAHQQRDELRKDAERYRKLCEAGGAIDAFVAAYHNTLVKEALDAAVDAVPAIRAA